MIHRCMMGVAACAALAIGASAGADVLVYSSGSSGNFFTPFNSGNASTGIRYGDSGWILGPGQPPVEITRVTLQLATVNGTAAGSTDIKFTFNDGDPSGMVFGPGTALYSTTITNVALPTSGVPGLAQFFSLDIPLPSVFTTGGFNNVGFSIELQNYSFNGQMGFQTSSFTSPGFSTTNASFYNGSSWSLFSFGGPAQLAFDLYTVPAPSAAGVMALGLLAMRRRRTA